MQFKTKRNRAGVPAIWIADQSLADLRKEDAHQIDLAAHCAVKWPDGFVSMYHVVNESGGKGSAHYGVKLRRMGRKKGVSDWVVAIPSGGHHGLFLELKRESKQMSSPVSTEQRDFLLRQEALGYACIVSHGYRAAIHAIDAYLKGNWSDLIGG